MKVIQIYGYVKAVLVCPHLECNSCVWNPHRKKHVRLKTYNVVQPSLDYFKCLPQSSNYWSPGIPSSENARKMQSNCLRL